MNPLQQAPIPVPVPTPQSEAQVFQFPAERSTSPEVAPELATPGDIIELGSQVMNARLATMAIQEAPQRAA